MVAAPRTELVALARKLLVDERGATASEYALILAVVGVSIAAGAYLLGTSITMSMDTQTANLKTCGGRC